MFKREGVVVALFSLGKGNLGWLNVLLMIEHLFKIAHKLCRLTLLFIDIMNMPIGTLSGPIIFMWPIRLFTREPIWNHDHLIGLDPNLDVMIGNRSLTNPDIITYGIPYYYASKRLHILNKLRVWSIFLYNWSWKNLIVDLNLICALLLCRKDDVFGVRRTQNPAHLY